MYDSVIQSGLLNPEPLQRLAADRFPEIRPVHWLHSHFAVGGWSPLQRLSGMLTAHMTTIAPHSGFTWHPHRGLEIYTWVLDGALYHEDTTGGKGEIRAGELQRMFSGDWIEHQELNHRDEPVRVIQIWYAADPQYRGLAPHYQQAHRDQLPARRAGEAAVFDLIGADSPMEAHMHGRLTAAVVEPGGATGLEPPGPGEDLFLYVTDGRGRLAAPAGEVELGLYDVILARPDAPAAQISAGSAGRLQFLSFYLPAFLN